MKNQRIIHWWMGTDALKLVKVPPGKFTWRFRIYSERLLWKIVEPLITEHWATMPHIKEHLKQFGIKESKIKIVSRLDTKHEVVSKNYKKYPKKKHSAFNVLYYYRTDPTNQKFKDWCYGRDIFQVLKNKMPEINWIELDGKQDMSKIFPITDAYIRPNRSDGKSRLVMECELNNIPVLATYENPTVEMFEKFIRGVYDEK